tara:strand:- start:156 stop:905 length:750 start_codon:yes stop_codon:yes gene_type:complete
MSFKLKSGNKTSFKMMGSSPVKSNGETYNERIIKENKRLKEVYDQQMKSYSDSTASYENRIKVYDLFKGKRFTEGEFKKVREKASKLLTENVIRGIYDKSDIAFKTSHTNSPRTRVNQGYIERGWQDDSLTKEDIARELKPKKKPVKPKYHKTITEVPPLKPITPSPIKPTTPVMPKPVDVPDFPDPTPPYKPRKRIKTKNKVRKVRRPRGTRTRNLVTGGTNRTFRSTGTSRRKNRLIAGLTFWNRKD